MYRVVKPGGIVAITSWSMTSAMPHVMKLVGAKYMAFHNSNTYRMSTHLSTQSTLSAPPSLNFVTESGAAEWYANVLCADAEACKKLASLMLKHLPQLALQK